ncbi:MobQ family relaxase [Asticcacaulis sp. 201]|uniref:MobQ family relaxase n=1 Tax=Asticcacaulis sp. 201 TaxID=3028787 RepID=UPI0029161859|nr:MobQ family relaxase [Asticcacaulis sp. 201]MDV6333146.1 MobQ family relaxase [Asticcacaulis sp. 201]
MAIYHLRLKVLTRALGRAARPGGATRNSAVAGAAYRSGERLYDESQGKWFQYPNDVFHTEILAPEGAPAWVFDRQTLWNVVEQSEKRVDAQLYREIEITLPRELTQEQQITLVREFVGDQFVSLGMVADIGLHRPDASDGEAQPHAHVLLTMRRLDSSHPTGFSPTKERDWNERPDIARMAAEARKRFNDTGLPEDKDVMEATEALRNVNVWRAQWAGYANRALEAAGTEARIDHRTLEKQGIFRLPEIALGIARHIEKAYDYLKERITQWVAIKKRAELYKEVEHYRLRDPVQLAEFVLRLADMAEGFAASFRKPNAPIPEVPHER